MDISPDLLVKLNFNFSFSNKLKPEALRDKHFSTERMKRERDKTALNTQIGGYYVYCTVS